MLGRSTSIPTTTLPKRLSSSTLRSTGLSQQVTVVLRMSIYFLHHSIPPLLLSISNFTDTPPATHIQTSIAIPWRPCRSSGIHYCCSFEREPCTSIVEVGSVQRGCSGYVSLSGFVLLFSFFPLVFARFAVTADDLKNTTA